MRYTEDVGFVNGGHFAAPFPGSFEGHPHDAVHFRHAVLFSIPSMFDAINHFRFTALAKIDTAG